MPLTKQRFTINVWDTDPITVANIAIKCVQNSISVNPLIYSFKNMSLPMIDIVNGQCIITLFYTHKTNLDIQ